MTTDPQTKAELESALMETWATPDSFNEAYRLYALGEEKRLAVFLAGLADEEPPAEELEDDDDGGWDEPDLGDLWKMDE